MTPIFFVYWNGGSCNDGSCTNGLDAFSTLALATERMKELQADSSVDYIKIIAGNHAADWRRK